jgi:hypothetical protein
MTTSSTNAPTLGDAWCKPFYQGSMKANTGEEWSYDRGVVKCTNGAHKVDGESKWDGSQLVNASGKSTGVAEFDGVTIKWAFADDKTTFFVAKLSSDESTITWTMVDVKWLDKVNWTHDKKARTLTVDEPSAGPEGATTTWSVLGEVPPPVAYVIANYGRMLRVRELMIERLNRAYWRCKRLTLTAVDAYLCTKHAAEASTCMCCQKPASGHAGVQCKQCSVKGKFLCVKCNDPVGTTRVKGTLCDDCGLGSRSKECAKMLYKDLR